MLEFPHCKLPFIIFHRLFSNLSTFSIPGLDPLGALPPVKHPAASEIQSDPVYTAQNMAQTIIQVLLHTNTIIHGLTMGTLNLKVV